MMYANIIINLRTRALDQLYSYVIPPQFRGNIYRGQRVVVPFGRGQHVDGVVWSLTDVQPPVESKPISDVLPDDYALSNSQLQLLRLLRSRYAASYQEAYATVLPAVQKLDKNIVYSIVNPMAEWPVGELLSEAELLARISKAELKRRLANKSLDKHYQFTFKHKLRQIDWVQASFEDLNAALNRVSARATKKQRIITHIFHLRQLPLRELTRATKATRRDIEGLADLGLVRIERRTDQQAGFHYSTQIERRDPPALAMEQVAVVEAFHAGAKPRRALLKGVTGSGKTRVYIELAQAAIAAGQQVLLLVPEIALTPQLVERFASQLTDRIAVIHSHISPADKVWMYQRIKRHDVDVVIGARSALFAPIENLGLIIIDEEHEQTFKSETIPRYHAVALALALAAAVDCDIVLGSATPSIQSHHLVDTGHLQLLSMDRPISQHGLSPIAIIDMTGSTQQTILSGILMQAIQNCLARGEQFILFHNRRGWASSRQCRNCGYVHMCQNCAVPMTVYGGTESFSCHYCGFRQPLFTSCPRCGTPLQDVGIGIEQILKELNEHFSGHTFMIVDAESTKNHKRYVEQLAAFRAGDIDGLIGTQVLAKGLDFANVTLVGVILADQLINFPDYRSLERSYQLLTQVAGRAGRAGKAGKTYIQTYQPEHPVIDYIVKRDYAGFVTEEKKNRDIVGYPPYVALFTIAIYGEDEAAVNRQAEQIYHFYHKNFARHQVTATVYPPLQPYYARIRNQYRAQLVIKVAKAERAEVLRMLYYGIVNNKYNLIERGCWVDLDFDG